MYLDRLTADSLALLGQFLEISYTENNLHGVISINLSFKEACKQILQEAVMNYHKVSKKRQIYGSLTSWFSKFGKDVYLVKLN